MEEFLYDQDFLGLKLLSDEQIGLVEAMTHIYRHDTVKQLWGDEEANRLRDAKVNEVIAQLGKSSGKDFCTTIAFARIVYLLLCLRDPAEYYNKPPGDAIHLLNVAINAKQAKNVFFTPFVNLIKRCAWFTGKYESKAEHIDFDKNITAHSGHSEREAWEGYNLIIVVLDEIAGFATEAETSGNTSNRGKTAESVYDMYAASVASRFPADGKLVLLSFPRFKNDFIQKRYNAVVGEKVTETRRHTFKLHEHLPDGLDDNEFVVEWEYDKIVSYAEPAVYAMRRATWEVHPFRKIEDFKRRFYSNLEDSLARFACMPPDAVDAFFKDREKIEQAFGHGPPSPFKKDWSFMVGFQPDKEKEYYAHVDLGYTHDRAAVAMAHVKDWVKVSYGGSWEHYAPTIVLDSVRWWTPAGGSNVDLSDIEKHVMDLINRGFPVKLVTFDRWQSISTIQKLKKRGVRAETLSVAKPHYEDFLTVLTEERIEGYHLPLLVDELVGLRVIRGNKVDHPRKGSKDLADAVCGAVYNAIHNAKQQETKKVEVKYLTPGPPSEERNTVEPEHTPPKRIPKDISKYLDMMEVI